MAERDDFLNPLCLYSTLDIYGLRRAILSALKEKLGSFHGTLLDVGCGRMPYRPILLAAPSRVERYLGLDLGADLRDSRYSKFGPPDVEWDGCLIPLDSGSVDCAIATEVFEQCPDVRGVMAEIARVLKPGGVLFFTVPFLWPVHDAPLDQYRFTPFALERHLLNAGFERVTMKALGGWDASFAQMIGLWARRRPMGRVMRRIVSTLTLPIVLRLLRADVPPRLGIVTDETMMITGIAGTAVKGLTECSTPDIN